MRDISNNRNIEKNKIQRVEFKVYVEGLKDKTFWYFIFKKFCPDKYFHFTVFGNKKTIINKVSKYSIDIPVYGCIDADYDYLKDCPNIKHSNIFHTFAYSKENYSCVPCCLNDLLVELTHTPNHNCCDFNIFISKYSNLVYPVLQKIIEKYECNESQNNAVKDISKFGQSLKPKSPDCINSFLITYENSLKKNNSFTNISFKLSRKYCFPNNAYLFVRGHDLFEIIIEVLLCCFLEIKKNEFANINSIYPIKNQEHNDKIKQSEKIFGKLEVSKQQQKELEDKLKIKINDSLELNYKCALNHIDKIKPLQLLKADIEKRLN